MSGQEESTTMSYELNKRLAEEVNDEMVSSVLPVSIFVGIETVFGFFGNLLILYVFLFRYHSCNFKYFVLCLAFIDLTSTLTTMPGEIVTQTFWFVYPVPLICKIKSFFNVFTVCGSAFCLLLIAVDRFRKICHPCEWQVKPKTARVLCYVLITVSFIMALPCAFLWGTHSYQLVYKGQRVTVTVCEKDAEFLQTKYPLVYIIIVEVIISAVMIVLFALYVFVCRILLMTKPDDKRKSTTGGVVNKTMKELSAQDSDANISAGMTSDDELTTQNDSEVNNEMVTSDTKRDTKVTPGKRLESRIVQKTKSNAKMTTSVDIKAKRPTVKQQARRVRRKTLIMFILTAIFIVTTILYLTLLSLIANDFLQSLSSHGKAVYFFFFRLYFINHAVNPILYGFLDPHFRRVLKQIAKAVVSPCTRNNMVHSVSYSTESSEH